MDITTAFEAVIVGSNPAGSTETGNTLSWVFPAKVLTTAMSPKSFLQCFWKTARWGREFLSFYLTK